MGEFADIATDMDLWADAIDGIAKVLPLAEWVRETETILRDTAKVLIGHTSCAGMCSPTLRAAGQKIIDHINGVSGARAGESPPAQMRSDEPEPGTPAFLVISIKYYLRVGQPECAMQLLDELQEKLAAPSEESSARSSGTLGASQDWWPGRVLITHDRVPATKLIGTQCGQLDDAVAQVLAKEFAGRLVSVSITPFASP